MYVGINHFDSYEIHYVHLYFQTKNCIALVVDFAYGGDLAHRLHKVGRLRENEAKFYFAELASAVEYLHSEHSIVHRFLIFLELTVFSF